MPPQSMMFTHRHLFSNIEIFKRSARCFWADLFVKIGDVMEILEALFALQDESYADFQSKLTPGIPRERFIGVRVPELRKLAKQIKNQAGDFLYTLPHQYYDENLLHGVLISEMWDFDACVEALDAFLPFVDNWAVCDTMSPKVLQKDRQALLRKIRQWTVSSHTYTCRFGILCLMRYFLDKDFCPEYLQIPASIHSEEYYINMMIAWYFATALAKQWDATIPYLQERRLPEWVHRKTIQKARESDRISPEQKEYLRSLK